MKDVSIILVTHKRLRDLTLLLEQISIQFSSSEIVIIINNDKTTNYAQLKNKYPFLWLEGNFETPGLARNYGISQCQNDWLLFLDDDIQLPDDFSITSQNIFKNLSENVVAFGGPDQNPPQSNLFSNALSLTLTSPLATAHTRLRHSKVIGEIQSGDESNLILCNLWIKKEFIINNNIKFNEFLFRNEENLLIEEVLNHGGNAEYYPELSVFHRRKTRLDHLSKAVFSSGKHRIKSIFFNKRLFNFLFLIPALLVLYVVSLPFLSKVPYVLVPLKIYLTLSLFISLKVSSNKASLWPLVILYQIFLNILYGLGIIYGLICWPYWHFRLRK